MLLKRVPNDANQDAKPDANPDTGPDTGQDAGQDPRPSESNPAESSASSAACKRLSTAELAQLAQDIKRWGQDLGLSEIGITDTDLAEHETHLLNWLNAHRHGEMEWMQRHGTHRSRPSDLVPGTVRVISVRQDYFPPDAADAHENLANTHRAYVSRYALGRDYHRVLRNRLQRLATRIEEAIGPFGYRAFTDSAPVLEKALAEKAGLGWIGKHANLISPAAGSWFFIGELYTDLPLPIDAAMTEDHCGSCRACIDACPTGAIVGEREVDARRCISYHTIELGGPIPVEFRRAMGNRIYGCDDCQLVCPFDKFTATGEPAFSPRHDLDTVTLIELFSWTERQFLRRFEGSPIRRIGHERWLRNIAIALGNAPTSEDTLQALNSQQEHTSEVVREAIAWAIAEHENGHGPGHRPGHGPDH